MSHFAMTPPGYAGAPLAVDLRGNDCYEVPVAKNGAIRPEQDPAKGRPVRIVLVSCAGRGV
jgi:hypothetical protein